MRERERDRERGDKIKGKDILAMGAMCTATYIPETKKVPRVMDPEKYTQNEDHNDSYNE